MNPLDLLFTKVSTHLYLAQPIVCSATRHQPFSHITMNGHVRGRTTRGAATTSANEEDGQIMAPEEGLDGSYARHNRVSWAVDDRVRGMGGLPS